MSHYHMEVIMPPTDNVETRLEQILAMYNENNEPAEDGYTNPHTFWDWYVIGGRWAGAHLKALVDPDQLEKFEEELNRREITISGLQCGKQELQPASQIPMVDKLWCEYFPASELKVCPLFNHFNNQYEDSRLDITTFDKITDQLEAFRLIIGGLDYKEEKFEAKFMLESETWNGCNFQNTDFDGPVRAAVDTHHKNMEHYKDSYRKANTVRNDWLVITIDYHS